MGTWMVLAVEMVGADECKEKTKNKYLLKPDGRELAGALRADTDHTGCGRWTRMDSNAGAGDYRVEWKQKYKKQNLLDEWHHHVVFR